MSRSSAVSEPSGAVAPEEVSNVPAVATSTGLALGGYDADEIGSGFEDLTLADLTIPFLALLQSGSPQVKEDKGVYVPGAKAGMFMNTVSQELFDGKKGVKIIPVHRKHSFREWIPRDQGGGMVSEYSPNDPRIVALRKKTPFGGITIEDATPFKKGGDEDEVEHEGNDIVETFVVFALIVRDNGSSEPVVMSFSSTQIKHYRKWMTTARGIQIPTGDPSRPFINPPLYAHFFRVRSQYTEKKGFDWYSFQVGFENGVAETSRVDRESPLYRA